MSSNNTVYELTETGMLAKNSKSFKNLSPAIADLLSEIVVQNKVAHQFSAADYEQIDWLQRLGLVKKPSNVSSTDDPGKNPVEPKSIKIIKQEFVDLVKKDLSNHEQYWDVLMNLEIVDNKDGLLWFMNQITQLSDSPNQQAYQALFKALMELEK